MRVHVVGGVADLARDLKSIKVKARKDMRATVRDGIRAGNTLAKANAERSSGRHGKHYPKAFRAEMNSSLFGSGSATISGEYGPITGPKQGRMSFENGSRNQKPHRDLARSADVIGGSFAQEVRALPDRWFW